MQEKQINTNEELRETLDAITFTHSTLDFKWQYEFVPIELKYDGEATYFDINQNAYVKTTNAIRNGWLVWASFERPDVNTGKISRGRGRDEIVFNGWSESAVVKTAWVIFEMLIKHEQMESFQYKNKRIFNPHHTVEQLSSI